MFVNEREKFHLHLRECGFIIPFNWEEVRAFYLYSILKHLESDFIEAKITNEELDISVREL